jgi:hypothetical protein
VSRHAFVQTLDGDRLLEHGLRSDAGEPRRGWVVDAAYLGWSASQRLPWRLFAPLFGIEPARRVRLPFTETGDDALGLLSGPLAEGNARVVGKVEALGPRSSVLDDVWLIEPFCRVVELDDFVVIPEPGEPVVISCGLAPLLIAPPARRDLAVHRETLSSRTLGMLPKSLPLEGELLSLSVRAGMRIEVVGVARELSASVRRAALEPATSAYRARAERSLAMIGDEDGTRLVLRVL